jgi:hypothetical protein
MSPIHKRFTLRVVLYARASKLGREPSLSTQILNLKVSAARKGWNAPVVGAARELDRFRWRDVHRSRPERFSRYPERIPPAVGAAE